MHDRPLSSIPKGIAISRDVSRLAEYSQDASGLKGAVPIALVQPTELAQIPDLVRWAARNDTPLVPVSSPHGPRRGGDTLASRPSVVVDLSGFDRIRMVDGRDRIALVEPGVTFSTLDRALQPYGLRAFRPLLPRAGKSVLASYLDREPITSPAEHWDSADPLAAIEVVFGDGTVFRTGGASAPGNPEDNLAHGMRFMVSLGPGATDFARVLQGAQGSLGIATWGTVYCEPIPALEGPRCFGSAIPEPLLEFAAKLCRRRFAGQLFIVNAIQAATMMSPDRDSFNQLSESLPRWILYFNHGVPNYLPEERLAYERVQVGKDADSVGVSSVHESNSDLARMLRRAQFEARSGCYKDKPFGSHSEFYFLSQLDRAEKQLHAISDGACPLGIYIQPLVHGVNCHVELSWLHDAGPSATKRAREALERSVALCIRNGAFVSRPKAPWGEAAFAADPTVVPFLKAVKRMFDPNMIFAPGRLCF